MKRILALSTSVVAAAALATAGSAMQAKPRSGPLQVTKECSQYNGSAGSFCTITSSNIAAIKPGMRVVYADPVRNGVLDSDLAVSRAHGPAAFGHVVLNLTTRTGRVTFSGGTGKFKTFRADVAVSVDASGVIRWDGTYSFDR